MILFPLPVLGQPGPTSATESSLELPRKLTLAEVQLLGATRTKPATVYRYLELEPGQEISQTELVTAVERLRDSRLFRGVDFFTRPGAGRGQLVLVLEVQEHGLDFRWAAGNTDLDGWYLVPAMVAYDNPLGRGGQFDLQFRFGFRHGGSVLRYSRSGPGRNYWQTRLYSLNTERPYFSDEVEYRHSVQTGGISGVLGRRLSDRDLLEFGLALETVDAADHSTSFLSSPDGSIGTGQEVSRDDLPAAIGSALGPRSRTVLHLDWQHDTRATRLRAGTPTGGIWGRIKGTFVFQDQGSHHRLQADLRLFREAPGGALAARIRGAWVGDKAAFYDRLYLGGIYSVRGFPTHSLSAPGGDTWLVSGSLEYRSRILGDHRGTRLAGILFCDAGSSGQTGGLDPYPRLAVGAGYGLRWKVWWLDWVGLDVGFPLTERPLDMKFQVNASIGWSF